MKIPLSLTALSVLLLAGLPSAKAQTGSQPASQPQPAPATNTVPAPSTNQGGVAVRANKEDLSKLGESALIKKLEQVLSQIQGLIRSRVDPVQVEDKLRSRIPSYRQVQISDAPSSGQEDGTVPIREENIDVAPETPVASVRLLGDAEKADLPKGTVLLVEGLPIKESEVQDLESYYNSYSSQKPGTAREKALEALIVLKTVQAQAKDNLSKLEKEMATIRKSIVDGGQDFADVAKKRSQGPSSTDGGNLGYFFRDQMVATFSRAAFALKLGEVSQPFPSPFGIHILKITGRKKGTTPSEDQVKASHILLMYDKDSDALTRLMQQATSGKSKIAVLNDDWRKSLPAAYR